MEKVSVIVPIYNAGNYLDKCINSIVNQTYSNLEIILIDDGSNDNSPEIYKIWCEKDDRIKTIVQENSGQASARNRGLDCANGKYICFVDSDDYIDSLMIEKMVTRMEEDASDICCCGMNLVYANGDVSAIKRESKIIRSAEAFKDLFNVNGSKIGLEVWNKIYKNDIFKKIRFSVDMIYEDAEINIRILENDYLISVMEEPFYNYFQSENSTMRKKFNYRDFDRLKVWKTALDIAIKTYPNCVEIAKIRKLRCEIYLLYKGIINKIDFSQDFFDQIRNDILKTPIKNIIKLRGIKEKIFFLCLKVNFIKTFLFLGGKIK